MAEDVGYEKIFTNASLPAVPPTDEVFGFELDKDLFQLASADTNVQNDIPQEDLEQAEITNDNEDTVLDAQERTVAADISDDISNMNAAFEVVLARNVSHRATSLQSFFKFSGDRPWIPFSVDSMDPIAVEERKVFKDMNKDYSRRAAPSADTGYNHFMKAWNEESGRRYIARLTDDSVTIIYRKSLRQLQEYYDKLQDIRTASIEAQDSGNRRLRNLHQVLRQAQKNTAPPVIRDAVPRRYPDGDATNTPSGHPFVLNSSVAMATVGRRRVASSVALYAVPAAKQPCTENT